MRESARNDKARRHRLNYSEAVVRVQRLLLAGRGEDTIAFFLDVRGGFDHALMRQAVALLYARHDSLRLTFTRRGFSLRQYFAAERSPGPIEEIRFEDAASEADFALRLSMRPMSLFKGQTLRVFFVTRPDGTESILCQVSHYAADLYGAGVLASDLFAVYDALAAGGPLPPAPGSYEEVVRMDNRYDADRERRRRDRVFYRDYVSRLQRPLYCGIDKDAEKRRSPYYLSLDPLHQEALSQAFDLPAATLEKLEAYGQESGFSLSLILYCACALASSLQRGKARHLAAMQLVDCRGSVRERKAAGTKVQALASFIEMDYGKSFADNLTMLGEDMNELYRHPYFPFMRVNLDLHRRWFFPLLGYAYSFIFSYVPQSMPEHVSFRLVESGRSTMLSYVVLRHDLVHKQLSLRLIVRKKLAGKAQLEAFRDCFVHVLDRVLAAPGQPLDQIL